MTDIPRTRIKPRHERRPEFSAEAREAKGKKYIIMSDSDKIEYSTDDKIHAVAAFAATIITACAKYGITDDDTRVKVVPIPTDMAKGVTPSEEGIVAFLEDRPETPIIGEQAVLAVGFGISRDDWRKITPEALLAKHPMKDYAFRVMGDEANEVLETDDREEAYIAFTKTAVEATQKYGYGPTSPVAIQFQPVPDEALDHYPARDRLKKKAVTMASISGQSILLSVIEGVEYEEFSPVAEKYLAKALGGQELVKKLPDDVDLKTVMKPPENLLEGEDAIASLGSRYAVMDEHHVRVLKTDDEYEAILRFYDEQARYGKKLEAEFGGNHPIDYIVEDGPKWSDTLLPTLVARLNIEGKRRANIVLVGMSKRQHDLYMEPQKIPTGERKSPWGATLH